MKKLMNMMVGRPRPKTRLGICKLLIRARRIHPVAHEQKNKM